MAAYYAREYTVSLNDEATRLHGAEMSAAAGRFFSAGEDAPRPKQVVVPVSDRCQTGVRLVSDTGAPR
jgi:hypothetical protein